MIDHGAKCNGDPCSCSQAARDKQRLHKAAAQLRMITDKRQGKPTPAWVERLANQEDTTSNTASEVWAAGYAAGRARALADAADALEQQPPKAKTNYIATLRLYATEPWRLGQPKPNQATRGPVF